MIGQTISHYKILEKLGEGGMGVVYKAEDIKLKRIVALKFLPQHLTKTEEEQARFLQEAQAAATLNHPNVCSIHAIEEHDGQQLIDMEFVDGMTLRQQLQSGKMTLDAALSYSVQIADALHEAHSKGIVHRDIKPDNIMVNSKKQIKVMDFGLAKLKGTLKLTRTSSTVGTLAYMAPEQIQGGDVDARSDIFSFGVLLFEMLAGRSPFRGDYEAAMMYSILNEEPDPLTKYLPEASSELTHILGRALDKDPEDRYQSVHEMLIDLRRLKKDSTKVVRTAAHKVPQQSRVAPIEPVAQALSATPSAAHTTSVTINFPTMTKRTFVIPALIVGLLILAAIAFILFFPTMDNGERLPVAVADFVNQTSEKELDGLSGMLITSMEQSKRLAVLTRARMFDILKQMGKENIDRIDEALGRDVCKQANIAALVTASIRKFGKLYTIDLKVLDPIKNEYLFTAKEEGEGQESIPKMLDLLSEKTRLGLKEKASEVRAANKKLEEVTTTNLEAYQHYFQGEHLVNKLNFVGAEKEFEKAIELDSTFALAYYRYAYTLAWQLGRKTVRAGLVIEKALALSNHLPEKEQYLVRALRSQIQGRLVVGIEILKEAEQRYPDDKEVLYNIGDWSWHVGDFTTAADRLEKVLAIDPVFERALEHLAWTYRDIEQTEKFLSVAKRYVTVSGSAEAYSILANAHASAGKYAEGVQTLRSARDLFPKNFSLTSSLANLFANQNDYQTAEQELQSLVDVRRPLEARQLGYSELAQFYPYLGKYNEALKSFDKVMELAIFSRDTTGFVMARVQKAYLIAAGWNKLDRAWEEVEKVQDQVKGFGGPVLFAYYNMLTALKRRFVQADSIAATSQLPWWQSYIRSLIAFEKEEYLLAEAYADSSIAGKPVAFARPLILFLHGQASLKNNREEDAIKSFMLVQKEQASDYGFRAIFYPKSYYALGLAYEQKGDKKRATESYDKLLTLWKNADKDLPELIDAKARLAKIKSVAPK